MRTIPATPSNRLPSLARIYPFTSRPLTDLQAVLLLFPLFWFFGLEQILSPLLIFLAAFKLVLSKPRLRIPGIVFPFVIFLFWQIISQLVIEQSSDRIVFGRNLISYISAFLIVLIIANEAHGFRAVHGLIYAMVGLSVATTAVGLLFALGILPDRFQALLIGDLLPDVLKNSRFVQENILLRVVGQSGATFGPFIFPRARSLFLFATEAGAAYVIFLFWQLYLFKLRQGLWRWLMGLLIFLSLVVFLLTAARIAWGAFLISFILLKLFRYQTRLRLPVILLPLTLIILGVALTIITLNNQTPWQLFNMLFVEVRTGSLYDRLSVYEATLRLWAERPITGWGAPKAVSGVNLAPAGTHSQLLGILFRFGLIGFFAYFSILVLIWAQINHKLSHASRAKDIQSWRLILIIATIFLSILIMHLFYEFYFDYGIVLLSWTTIGLAYSRTLSPEQIEPG
jgi:O-antigen ligase